MKFQSVFLGLMLCAGGLQAETLTNSGKPLQFAGNSQSASITSNPFTKQCAAVTKAKFAVMYLRGNGDCLLGSDAFGPSKNLAAFSSPETGVYCFTPSKAAGLSGDKLLAAYPTVDIEWGSSSGSDLLAYVYRGAGSCPAGSIEVRTYDFAGGSPTLTDDVAFYLKVN
jgi:hypothetical protein